MDTPEYIQGLFEKRNGKRIIGTGIQSTSIQGNPDYPNNEERWVWVDFEDLSRITIRVALLDDGPTVIGFTESPAARRGH
jgi:hypothetical protein